MSIASQILNGKLTLPTINDLRSEHPSAYPQIEAMFTALWNAYLAKGPGATVSSTYWAQRVANPKAHNIALKILSQAGWITISTQPNRNWSEMSLNQSKLLEYVTQEDLDNVRKYNKFSKYTLVLCHVMNSKNILVTLCNLNYIIVYII